ncbi:maltose ABC transporter substrate-binding protein [Cystobacter fuscus]|uniref:Maltose ABC transporter substrate-binding protein n=1 Tax=Cystobacter fuscus TaxID=43 RepID=A0A250J9Y6_9BACT|nr:ABC transporter substrate-binding protein [Cystobacter fuscus]ATB40307.1 maltose ABC transporter substrate-binding protein [Cystobacter fuscus]
MRHVLMAISVAATLVVPTVSAAETVAISCGTVGKEFELCKQGAEAWAKKSGHEVKLVSGSTDASEQLTVFQQQLSAGSPDIDVFRVDVVWPGILGAHFIDLKKYIPDDVVKQHFPAIVENNTVDGKLVAMPWFTDAGVLYYRKDLLEKYKQKPPTTWQELATTAKLVQDAERKAGNDKMVGFVFQAKAAETLTCNALEWIDSFGGGAIVDKSGKVNIDNPKAAEALKTAASWIGTIAPQGVLNYEEEGARGVFQSGNAVFMRNWPYAWALANSPDSPINGKVGVVALPKGGADGKSTGTLGGWNLSVSKYSKHPEIAADLVKYLASPEEQKRRAILGSFNPTIVSLYKDADVLKANPFFGTLLDTFTNAVARPAKVTGAKYSRVSADFRNTVHSILSGGAAQTEAKVKDLQKKLERIGKNGKW